MANPQNRRAKKKVASGKPKANRRAAPRKVSAQAASAPSRRRAGNRKAPRRQPAAPPQVDAVDAGWGPALRLALGILLVPVALVTALALFDTFTATAIDGGAWRAQGFWFFCLGALLWAVSYWGIPWSNVPYVLGHELTHAFFVYLCGGRVEKMGVDGDGGFVVTNKTNLLIVLSPYFVPFYTVVVLVIAVVLGQFVDLGHTFMPWWLFGAPLELSWVLFGLIGFTWCFHLTYTVAMIGKDQPDLHENGVFFSLIFIFLINLALIATGLILASPETGFADFGTLWTAEAEGLLNAAGVFLDALIPWPNGS